MSTFSLRTGQHHVEQHHSAMPDTIADMMNTIGISTLPHQGLALTDPKMKPT